VYAQLVGAHCHLEGVHTPVYRVFAGPRPSHPDPLRPPAGVHTESAVGRVVPPIVTAHGSRLRVVWTAVETATGGLALVVVAFLIVRTVLRFAG